MLSRRLSLPLVFVSSLLSLARPAEAALVVASRLPADHAKSVSPDTHLNLTFNAPPAVGAAGRIRIYDTADNRLVDTLDLGVPVLEQNYTIEGVQFHAPPVLVHGNTAVIYPHNNVLAYGKIYAVQIDPGVLTDGQDAFAGYGDSSGWTFTTKAAAPRADSTRLVVAADGTGDFATIQGAADFVPANNATRVTIFIRKGEYTEILSVNDKANITFLGEDRAQTILDYTNNYRLNLTSSNRGVLQALRSTGIVLANFSIRNTTPKGHGGWQAECIIFKSNSQVILSHMNLYSFQDTLQISCPGYVEDTYIEGDIDFMWGTGAVFFRNCEVKALTSGDAFTQSRSPATTHGFVYLNCKFDADPGVTGTFLGSGGGSSELVLLNCTLNPTMLAPAAWRGGGANTHAWEYNSTNIGDGQPADVSHRAAFSRQLTKEKDAELIANYSNPTFVLGGWTPVVPPLK